MSIPDIENAIFNIIEKADRINIEGVTDEGEKDSDVPTYNANGVTETPDDTLHTINIYGATEDSDWNPNHPGYNIEGLTDDVEANDDVPWYQAYGVDGHTIHVFLEANYDYPVVQLGRKLPALITIYEGIEQDHEAINQTGTTYTFENTLYLATEGKTLETSWHSVKMESEKILARFRINPTLNGTCWGSIISSGASMIDASDQPKWLGHTFTLEARKTESY